MEKFSASRKALIAQARSNLLEHAERLKAAQADQLRGGKSALSEKDKRDLARILDTGRNLHDRLFTAERLQRLWSLWDARRSRLNRDFEVARIEFEHRRRLSAADYEANRRRNSL